MMALARACVAPAVFRVVPNRARVIRRYGELRTNEAFLSEERDDVLVEVFSRTRAPLFGHEVEEIHVARRRFASKACLDLSDDALSAPHMNDSIREIQGAIAKPHEI